MMERVRACVSEGVHPISLNITYIGTSVKSLDVKEKQLLSRFVKRVKLRRNNKKGSVKT